MKNQVLRTIAMLSLLVTLALAGSAISSGGRLKVNIPFDFMVGKTNLKAGSYTFDSNIVHGVPVIGSADNRTKFFVGTFYGESSREPSRAKLVFRRYGNQYFLAQIWNEGSTVAMELPKSRAERELIKDSKYLARNGVEAETITLVAP